jgi:hypothetical protein
MLQLLSFALFTTVLLVSSAAIIATIRAELPYILRALGIAPSPLPPLNPTGERRVRVIRRPDFRPMPQLSLRAAA